MARERKVGYRLMACGHRSAGYVLLALIIPWFSLVCGQADRDMPAVSLQLEGRVRSADSVIVDVTFFNRSAEPINLYNWKTRSTMGPAIGSWLTFEIILDNDGPFECIGYVPSPLMPYEGDHVTIEPDSSYSESFILNKFYRWRGADQTEGRNWPTGNYHILCRYAFPGDSTYSGGAQLWRGSVESNEVVLKVE